MRVDRQIEFEAQDDAEAIQVARERLGREAVILSSRLVKRGGFLGLFRRKALWVTAGLLDEDPAEIAKENRERLFAFQQLLDVKRAVTGQPLAQPPAREPFGGRPVAVLESQPPVPPVPSPSPLDQAQALSSYASASRGSDPQIQAQVDEIRDALSRVLQRMDRPGEAPDRLAAASSDPDYQKLLRSEVDPEVASRLLEEFHREPGENLAAWLAGRIPVLAADPWNALGGKRIMFVGPTGVGKTTSIAKIAAIHSLWEGRKVVLVTADTYRIAAVEQLRTYAKILGIPLEVAFDPQELEGILTKHRNADLVLLDTAGRSHKDAKRMDELKGLHEIFCPDAVHLVLASNLKYRDMLDVIDRMGVVPLKSILFTKMDETSTFGPLLNVVEDFDLPLSFFTVGQNVPNDIEVARGDRLAGLVVGGDRLGDC